MPELLDFILHVSLSPPPPSLRECVSVSLHKSFPVDLYVCHSLCLSRTHVCGILSSLAFCSRPKIATHSVRLYNTSKHAATRLNTAIQCCQRQHTATMVSLWRLLSGLFSWSLSHSPHSLFRSKTGNGAPVLNRNR